MKKGTQDGKSDYDMKRLRERERERHTDRQSQSVCMYVCV